MRIGIFTDAYNPYVSGVVTSINMLEDGLKKLGHEVFIFTINLDGKEEVKKDNVLYFKGVKIRLNALSRYKYVVKIREKAEIIKKYNLDFIHIHNEFSMGKIGLRCAKKYNIPMIYTFHTLYEDYLNYFSPFLDKYFHKMLMSYLRTWIKPITKHALLTIVPTEKVVKQLNKYGIKSNYKVIPTGIDLEKFKVPANAVFIDEFKVKYNLKNEFIFMSIGRISEEKSLDVIVNAFSKISSTINAKLIFVGTGPYVDDLKQLIKEKEISDKTILVGEVSWNEIHKYYKLGNIVVNASMSETQGLTNIETLASGKPLLVQQDESIEDIVKDGYNGIIFNGENELSEKMYYCYNNANLLDKLENNCYKSVEKYSNICYANSVLEIYKTLKK